MIIPRGQGLRGIFTFSGFIISYHATIRCIVLYVTESVTTHYHLFIRSVAFLCWNSYLITLVI